MKKQTTIEAKEFQELLQENMRYRRFTPLLMPYNPQPCKKESKIIKGLVKSFKFVKELWMGGEWK